MNTEIGTIRYGHPVTGKRGRYIYLACPDCGKARWVNYYSLQRPNYNGRCKSCDGKLHGNLFEHKGNGRYVTTEGYVMVQLEPDSFYYPMAEQNGYVKEHRLIMAMHLGRCLMPFEVVHHINNVRADNRLENLKLDTPSGHVAHHNANGAYRGKYTMKTARHLY